jgi:hypothetical protein
MVCDPLEKSTQVPVNEPLDVLYVPVPRHPSDSAYALLKTFQAARLELSCVLEVTVYPLFKAFWVKATFGYLISFFDRGNSTTTFEFKLMNAVLLVFLMRSTLDSIVVIPVSKLPSPKNEPAVTFPVTTTFEVAVNEVIALENWTVLDVTFPLFTIWSKLEVIPVSPDPSPINLSACTLPVATSPVVALVNCMILDDVFDTFKISLSP